MLVRGKIVESIPVTDANSGVLAIIDDERIVAYTCVSVLLEEGGDECPVR